MAEDIYNLILAPRDGAGAPPRRVLLRNALYSKCEVIGSIPASGVRAIYRMRGVMVTTSIVAFLIEHKRLPEPGEYIEPTSRPDGWTAGDEWDLWLEDGIV